MLLLCSAAGWLGSGAVMLEAYNGAVGGGAWRERLERCWAQHDVLPWILGASLAVGATRAAALSTMSARVVVGVLEGHMVLY